MIRTIFIVFAFSLCMTNSFAQDCSTVKVPYFKARMILVDSVGVEYIHIDGVISTMYKFKIDHLYGGEYNCDYVWIVPYNDRDIYHFNPFKNKGKEYWWGSSSLNDTRDGIPVYRHCSNF